MDAYIYAYVIPYVNDCNYGDDFFEFILKIE